MKKTKINRFIDVESELDTISKKYEYFVKKKK